MTEQSVEQLMEHLSRTDPLLYAIVEEVRSVVVAVAPAVEQRVMYGGIVFEAPVMFGGVFAYSRHVSVEFSRGCDLPDPYGVLEGKGVRRHIKLREISDVERLHVREFISLAYAEISAR